jgi:type IV secretion system protein VirB4
VTVLPNDYLLIAILVAFLLLLGFGFFIVARQGIAERKPGHREALSDHLQWGALVAPGIILNKNRTLLRTIAFRGPDLAASSDEEMMVVTAKVNNALKRLGTGWTYFIEAQRFQQDVYPQSRWSEVVAWLVDRERQGNFEDKSEHFESSYYLSFVWERPQPLEKRLVDLFYENPKNAKLEDGFTRDLDYFIRATTEITTILDTVFPSVGVLDDGQLLSYLHSTISAQAHPVAAPDLPMYLDAYIPDQPFMAGEVAMVGDYYMPTLSVTGFPHTTTPGVLDKLNYLNIEYRWVNRFICLDKGEAMSTILRQRRYWTGKVKNIWIMLKETAAGEPSRLLNTDAQNKADDADAASQELGMDLVAYGQYTTTVTVWDKNLQQAINKLHEVKKILNASGFVVKDERLYAFEAWKGSLPGEIRANVRRPLVNTINLAHMMPVSSIWAGDVTNQHLLAACGEGNPHMVCSTTGSTPFRLNLNVGDVGHTVIIGPTGSGKSTLLAMLELQWLKYPQAQVIIFDKDRSARAATMAVGGQYYEPGNEDAAVAFQPLAQIDREGERNWALRYVCDMLELQNLTLTPAITQEVEGALRSLADAPPEQRTLTGLHALCQNAGIRDALHLYTLSGAYGQLFDADQDELKSSFWLMFEMTHVMEMGEQVVIPTLSYLFHRIEKRFDGRPTLLVLDECWLFLRHGIFASRLQSWLKTLRKRNVYVVFATQEPADAAESSISPTIISACPTRIFLPDAEATVPEVAKYYKTFGLTNAELHIIANAQQKRDYYYRSIKGRRLFTLDMGPVALAFAGFSNPKQQVFLDTIEKKLPASRWAAAILKFNHLDWAVELLEPPRRKAA